MQAPVYDRLYKDADYIRKKREDVRLGVIINTAASNLSI